MRLPQVEPSDPYPQVAGDPAYDGAPGRGRAASAEGTEDARILWAEVAMALVAVLCALHLRVADRLLRAGFLDGREGFLLAVANAEGTYYRYMKAWLKGRRR